MSRASAELSPDRGTVIHRKGNWVTSFPVSELPSKIAFYRSLRDRKAKRYASAYAEDVAAL